MKGPGFYGQNFYIIKDEKELIRENLIRVLLTSPGERPMSDFGCRLKDYLLNQSNVLVQEVQDEIKKAEEHAARINVVCKIKETFDDFNLDTVIRF